MRSNGSKNKVRPQQVLGELAELSDAQLDRLLPQVLALRAGRSRHVLVPREAHLLECVSRPLPPALQTQFDRLVAKRRAGTLTRGEVRTLHKLTDRVELHDARRLRCLVELAGLRKTTLHELMRSLGLRTPAYA